MTDASRPRGARATRSIAAQLSLHFSLTTIAIVLAIGAGMYALLSYALRRENGEQAMMVLQAIATRTDAADDVTRLPLQGSLPTEQFYWARVLDSHLRVVAQSDDLPAIPMPKPGVQASPLRRLAASERMLLVATGWTHPQGSLEPHLVQVCLDVTDDEALLDTYSRILAIVLLLAAALAFGNGIWIARRGLRPLRAMASAAERIDAAQLHQRLSTPEWPAELAVVAEAFDRMLERLDRAFQGLSRVSYDLAHELRTPLNNLAGEAEVALSRERDPERYRQVLGSALEEVQRLSKIVDTLLFFARLDNPDQTLQAETFDAAREIAKVLEYFEPVVEENGVRLTLTGAATLRANLTLFDRAIHNLVSNAVQHTPRGGSIEVTLREDGPMTIVTVRDDGRGIPAHDLPHVFDRFYRTATSRDARLSGSGLGLSIVQSVIEWHKGRATIESVEEQGTTVVLTFPSSARAAKNGAQTDTPMTGR